MNISKLSYSTKMSLAAFALLILGTTAFLLASQQTQENRSRASGPTTPIVDSSSSARASFTSSLTYNHTVTTNADRLLLVSVSIANTSTTVSSVTYAGVPLTKIARKGNSKTAEEMWYLISPNTGVNNVVVTLSGSVGSVVAGSTSFYNVDQVNPIGGGATSSGSYSKSTSVTVSGTNSNQLVVDALSTYLNVMSTVKSGQTQLWNLPGDGSASTRVLGAGSVKAGGAGSTTMGWMLSTYRYWSEIAVAINPAPVVATPTPTLNLTPTDTPTPTPTPAGPTVTPTLVPGAQALVLCPECNFVAGNVSNRLSGKDFTDAYLWAIFAQGVNLSNSNFMGANLEQSSLTNANLSNSNFTNVDFTGANLTGATTTGATFTGAIWSVTTCPDGTNSDENGNTCEGHLNP